MLLFHAQVLIRHFSFYFHFANNARRMPNLTDQNCVKMIYEKLSHLYNRIIKTHENINNMLDSIRIWAKVPFCKRQEGTATTLLDIDDRSLKCSTQCGEVNNSKKLIEYTMEENYRLLFGLPSLERKREFGKDRFRNTIIRKFGRHRAKEKIERLPSMVRKFQNLLNSTSSVFHTISMVDVYFLIFFFFFLSFFLHHSIFHLLHANFKVELLPTDSSAAVEFVHPEKIAKSVGNLKLFRAYEEYIDRLISQALLCGIESR